MSDEYTQRWTEEDAIKAEEDRYAYSYPLMSKEERERDLNRDSRIVHPSARRPVG